MAKTDQQRTLHLNGKDSEAHCMLFRADERSSESSHSLSAFDKAAAFVDQHLQIIRLSVHASLFVVSAALAWKLWRSSLFFSPNSLDIGYKYKARLCDVRWGYVHAPHNERLPFKIKQDSTAPIFTINIIPSFRRQPDSSAATHYATFFALSNWQKNTLNWCSENMIGKDYYIAIVDHAQCFVSPKDSSVSSSQTINKPTPLFNRLLKTDHHLLQQNHESLPEHVLGMEEHSLACVVFLQKRVSFLPWKSDLAASILKNGLAKLDHEQFLHRDIGSSLFDKYRRWEHDGRRQGRGLWKNINHELISEGSLTKIRLLITNSMHWLASKLRK
eukprot:gene3883-6373_t